MGERVLVRYFEGAQIGKSGLGVVVPVHSLKDGMIGEESGGPSGKKRALAASVERVDIANQEITLKGSDDSLETIMVSNPEYLSHIKVGDRVVITRPQGLALSLEKVAIVGDASKCVPSLPLTVCQKTLSSSATFTITVIAKIGTSSVDIYVSQESDRGDLRCRELGFCRCAVAR